MYSLSDAIEDYLSDSAVGLAPSTLASYRALLDRLKFYLRSKHISPYRDVCDILTVELLTGFVQWLSQQPGHRANGDHRPISKVTLSRYLGPLSGLYFYLIRERKVKGSVADSLRLRHAFHQYRKGRQRPLPIVSQSALDNVIKAARRVKANRTNLRHDLIRLRDIAMFEALRSSGMRVNELVQLRRKDFDYREQTAIVKGKGDRERVVFFYPKAFRAMMKYWHARQDSEYGKRETREFPAFIRHDRKVSYRFVPMTTEGVRKVLASLLQQAGIDHHVTPHSFRHGFATRILDRTGDLTIVQELLGHQQIETTRIYARVSSRRMREAHHLAFSIERQPERELDIEAIQDFAFESNAIIL